MSTNIAVQKMKRALAIVAMLLTLVFVMEPILSIVPTVSAQTTTRTRRRVRRHRSFWQKHRDKLTVAGTTVAGAGIGGIAGGICCLYKDRRRAHGKYGSACRADINSRVLICII